MIISALPPDSTLLTIEGPLEEEYVRRVLKSMWDCQKDTGGAQVRIGLEPASAPDYRIETPHESDDEQGTIWGAFSGRTHKPLAELALSRQSWSSESIPLPKISRLMGSVRASKWKR